MSIIRKSIFRLKCVLTCSDSRKRILCERNWLWPWGLSTAANRTRLSGTRRRRGAVLHPELLKRVSSVRRVCRAKWFLVSGRRSVLILHFLLITTFWEKSLLSSLLNSCIYYLSYTGRRNSPSAALQSEESPEPQLHLLIAWDLRLMMGILAAQPCHIYFPHLPVEPQLLAAPDGDAVWDQAAQRNTKVTLTSCQQFLIHLWQNTGNKTLSNILHNPFRHMLVWPCWSFTVIATVITEREWYIRSPTGRSRASALRRRRCAELRRRRQ